MSRGPGKAQRYILDRVADTGGPPLTPVRMLAISYAGEHGVPATAHLHASFRRAALGLIRSGQIKGWHLNCRTRMEPSTRSARWLLCVAPITMEAPTEAEKESAEFLAMATGGH